jgi:serine/threonine protein kinase
MSNNCPYCRQSITVPTTKAGRFKTKCPKCAKQFSLRVSADDPPQVTILPVPDAAPPETSPKPKPASSGKTPAATPGQKPEAPKSSSRPGQKTAAPKKTVPLQKPVRLPQPPPETTPEQTGASESDPTEASDQVTGAWEKTSPEDDQTGVTGAWDADESANSEPSPADETVDSGATAGRPVPDDADFSVDSKVVPKSKTAPMSGTAAKDKKKNFNVPEKLGGYEMKKELGHGGMGTVFLARQISLDRDVAVKIMNPEWAANPHFVARFTREAYAAAQLVHHNVVQIHDIGFEREIHFFSMEFVPGDTLSDVVKKDGKLDPQVAVGYILQAARGLKFAHDRGMVHRDVKPDNLMLNDQGVVKVADLGLVKTPAAVEQETLAEEDKEQRPPGGGSGEKLKQSPSVTGAHSAVGTPAYMAPEQARSAAGVDQRADIYSLGCTLYALLTGRQPFTGKTILEVISKHASEPVVPPEVVVKRVPKSLSAIIIKMMAKQPDDRYADLGDVIHALEEWLGVESTGPFTPKEEHADKLEQCVNQFNAAGRGRLKPILFTGITILSLVMVVAAAIVGQPAIAGGFLGLPILTLLAYFVISGMAGKTYVFKKMREYALGCGWTDWAMAIFGVIILLTILYLFNLLLVGAAFLAVAILVASAIYFFVDRGAVARQLAPVKETEVMLRNMRLNGLDENALRQFVCKYSGQNWEPFYEALFGYEAKIMARESWGRGADDRQRPRYGVWRDWLVHWADSRVAARRAARERRMLRKIEQKRLQAAGVSAAEAAARADQAAQAMVDCAAQFRQGAKIDDELNARVNLNDVIAAAEKPRTETRSSQAANPLVTLLGLLVGPKPRFIIGALLLVACGNWIHQNRDRLGNWQAAVQQAAEEKQAEKQMAGINKILQPNADPLYVPGIPKDILAKFFSSYNVGMAGLFLVLSALASGIRPFFFILPGVAILFAGHLLPVQDVPYVAPQVASLGVGTVLSLAGLLLIRRASQ